MTLICFSKQGSYFNYTTFVHIKQGHAGQLTCGSRLLKIERTRFIISKEIMRKTGFQSQKHQFVDCTLAQKNLIHLRKCT